MLRNSFTKLPCKTFNAASIARSGILNWSAGFHRTAIANAKHEADTVESFTENFSKSFRDAKDLFDVQRLLNNCFAYDLVPPPTVIEEALRAARRINDYPVAARVFEGLSYKVENKSQFEEYVKELKPVCDEIGIGDNGELEFTPK